MIHIQKQTWTKLTRYVLFTKGGSVQLEIYKEPRGARGVKAYLYALWVDPRHRRKGIAKALLNTAEEIARREGMDAVYLEWKREDAEWPGENHALDIFRHYCDRGYDDVEFGRDCSLMKLTLKEP